MAKTPKTLQKLFVEVERKFHPKSNFGSLLSHNSGGGDDGSVNRQPPFKSVQWLRRSRFHDIYYDHDDNTLSKRGLWIRCRDGEWQAKLKLGGDFSNSQFREISGWGEIEDILREYQQQQRQEQSKADQSSIPRRRLSDLKVLAEFTTVRDAWRVDDRFGVVVDETDFGHAVGEVELVRCIEVESGEGGNENELRKKHSALQKVVATSLDEDIESFMERYRWAFGNDKPVGKLSAYFAQKASMIEKTEKY